jgi:Lipopolysaccharide biosynthesis proteins, LPS:glycosyltransferases
MENTLKENITYDVLKPAFHENSVVVCFYGDEAYVPWIGIAVFSFCKNTSKEFNYDVIVIENEFSDESKQKIIGIAENRENISIRTLPMQSLLNLLNVKPSKQLSVNTYARYLVASDIFSNYNRIITIDSDVVVQGDFAELYYHETRGYPIAAVKDTLTSINVNRGYHADKRLQWKPYRVFFSDNNIDVNNYFNAGMILWDLERCRKSDDFAKILRLTNEHPATLFADQDILNIYYKNNWYQLDKVWNGMNIYACNVKKDKDYSTIEHAKVIHYLGSLKPWQDKNIVFIENYLEYARKTEWMKDLQNAWERYENTFRLLPSGSKRRAFVYRKFYRINDKINGWEN